MLKTVAGGTALAAGAGFAGTAGGMAAHTFSRGITMEVAGRRTAINQEKGGGEKLQVPLGSRRWMRIGLQEVIPLSGTHLAVGQGCIRWQC